MRHLLEAETARSDFCSIQRVQCARPESLVGRNYDGTRAARGSPSNRMATIAVNSHHQMRAYGERTR